MNTTYTGPPKSIGEIVGELQEHLSLNNPITVY